MHRGSRLFALSMAILIAAAPVGVPVAAYAEEASRLEDGVAVDDEFLVGDEDLAVDDGGIAVDDDDFAVADDDFAVDDDDFAVVGDEAVDPEDDVPADDAADDSDIADQSYVTKDGTVEDYPTDGKTKWESDDPDANATKRDSDSDVDSLKATISYRAHVANIGWQPYTSSIAGTTGQSKAIEALELKVANNPGGEIQCSAHVANVGWQDFTSGTAGTTGRGLQTEAFKIRLTGALAEDYDVYYRVHIQNQGWLGWAKNGEVAGSTGQGLRVEAIEVKLLIKGSILPGSTANHQYIPAAKVSVQAHVANIGWQGFTTGVAGTTGRSLAIEALNFSVANNPGGSIQCSAHVANIGWQGFTSGTAGTTGRSLQAEAFKIRLTGTLAENYDVYYRVHSQDFGWLGWAKNGEAAGTEGYSKRAEAIEVRLVAKGAKAPGSTANAFKKK